MRYIIPLVFLVLVSSCGSGDPSANGSDSLESIMASNSQWPFAVVGTLDIVEAGGYGDSEYPEWAVGSLITSDDPEGIAIEIGSGVVASSGIDIDSGKSVRVWLDQPNKQYGILSYPITKMAYE